MTHVGILLFCVGFACTMFGWFAGRRAQRKQRDRSVSEYINRRMLSAINSTTDNPIKVFDIEPIIKEQQALIDLLKTLRK